MKVKIISKQFGRWYNIDEIYSVASASVGDRYYSVSQGVHTSRRILAADAQVITEDEIKPRPTPKKSHNPHTQGQIIELFETGKYDINLSAMKKTQALPVDFARVPDPSRICVIFSDSSVDTYDVSNIQLFEKSPVIYLNYYGIDADGDAMIDSYYDLKQANLYQKAGIVAQYRMTFERGADIKTDAPLSIENI